MNRIVANLTAWFVRFIIGTGIAFNIVIGFHIGYLQMMPMAYWVDFESVKVDKRADGYHLIITREVNTKDSVTVVAFTEVILLHAANDGAPLAGCSSVVTTQSESDTGLIITPSLKRLLPNCDFDALIESKVKIQFVVEIQLPYTIKKRKRFVTRPFIFEAV